jgi:hypothetical protein
VSDFDVALERLVSDPAFREALAADPQRALAGYRLSPDELEVLTSQLDTGSGGQRHVEQRTSKASLFGLLSPMSGAGGFLADGSGGSFGADAHSGASFGADVHSGASFGADVHSGASFGADAHSGASFGADAHSGASFGPGATSGASFGAEEYQPRHSSGLGETVARAGDYMSDGGVDEPVLDDSGQAYHTRVDANGDGRWDQFTTIDRGGRGVDLAVDRNHDGRVDWVGHDLDRDGLIDQASVDHDYDGTLETRWVDRDGDGWMDAREPWPDPATAQGDSGSGAVTEPPAQAQRGYIQDSGYEAQHGYIEHPNDPR